MLKKSLPLFILLSSLPAALQASEPVLEEVVVRGDFRAASLMNSPQSVSVVDDEAAKQRGATHLEELLNTLPNVNFSAGSNRARFVQIRGIGERSQFKEPINPSVGTIIDGVDMSAMGSMATLFDLSQVEVFRGPQGTQFGANGLAGVINIESVAPLTDAPNLASLSVGNYGTHSVALAAGTTLDSEKKWGTRIALQQQASDGFYSNKTLGRDDTNGRDELSARWRLRYRPDDDSTIDVTLFSADIDNGYDAFTLDNTRTTLSDQPGSDKQRAEGGSLKAAILLSEKIAFNASVATAHSDSEYSYDEDWAYPTLAAGTDFEGWEYASFDQYLREQRTHSGDWRFVSTPQGRILGESSDWVLGYYAINRTQALLRRYTYLDGDFTSDYDTKNRAFYGQLDTHVSDSLTLSLGIRHDRWEAAYSDNNDLRIDSDEQLWGGKLGLQWRPDQQRMLYATLSRGYKPGGVNTDGTLPAAERDFATETLNSLELGYKWQASDGRLSLQSALFQAQRRDQQVKGAFLISRQDGSTEFIDYVENAARGVNRGIELEMQWLPQQDLSLQANLAWLDATFDEYFAPATQADPDGLDLRGRDQAHAPNYQAFVQAEYSLSQRWQFGVSVEAKDAFYFSDRHNARSDAFVLWNAQLIYRGEGWVGRLWGRNLGNEDVAVRGFGSFGNDPRNGYEVGQYVQYGEPRVVGLTAEWEF